jgi:hypothetical protein
MSKKLTLKEAKEYLTNKGITLTKEDIEEIINLLNLETTIPPFTECYYIDPTTECYYIDHTLVEDDVYLPNYKLFSIEESPDFVEVFDSNRELKSWIVGADVIWYMSSDGKAEEGMYLFI